MPDSDDDDTTMSNSSDAFVGAAGMNARNRGLSHEMIASDSTSSNWRSTTSGSLPRGPIRLGACSSNSEGAIVWSSGTGSSRSRASVYAKTAR